MFENLSQRAIHKNWKTTLFLFVLLAVIHFIAAYLKSLVINFVGLLLFALVTLILVRKSDWPAIRIRKPIRFTRVLWGVILSAVFVFGCHTILYLTVDYSPANFMVIMAKQQMSYGVISITPGSISPWQQSVFLPFLHSQKNYSFGELCSDPSSIDSLP
ncbi:MAG: hypothetical protein ACUVRM_01580 [Bacillota bacterium]